ncbi:MAG: hypothetical protein M3083_01865 [Actinomycetota bacterium]|nr:hypothetical protein [Actinomycetota bacterium]
MRTKRWAALGLVIALATGTGACAGGRVSLGTGASECFRDLPAARDALRDKGRLVGVRKVSADLLRARLPNDSVLSTLPDQDVCAFAFSGSFNPGGVTGAQNTKTGHYAIVAVGTKHPVVVAALVVDRLPTRFRHLR